MVPCRYDGRTSAAINFQIEASLVRTRRMVFQTADLMHAISISDARVSEPWWLASRLLDLNCDTCLMDERIWTGIHVIWTVAGIFPYLCFGKKSWSLIEHWESSGQAAELFGRMQAGAVRSFSTQKKVQTVIHVVRMDDALDRWVSGRYDMSSGRLTENQIFWLCKLCRIFWKHFWIAESLLKSNFTKKWFSPTECGQLQTNKLPLWPFWDKNTWPVKNTIPIQIKNYSPFLS